MKNLRRHKESAIELSRTIKCQSRLWSQRRRRSTGHIHHMVKTRYSNHQGSRSRQNPCHRSNHPKELVGNLSASSRLVWIRTSASPLLFLLLFVLLKKVNKYVSQHQGACSRGGVRGRVPPPGTAAVSKYETGCCVQARDRCCDQANNRCSTVHGRFCFAVGGGGATTPRIYLTSL